VKLSYKICISLLVGISVGLILKQISQKYTPHEMHTKNQSVQYGVIEYQSNGSRSDNVYLDNKLIYCTYHFLGFESSCLNARKLHNKKVKVTTTEFPTLSGTTSIAIKIESIDGNLIVNNSIQEIKEHWIVMTNIKIGS
jgi:L-cystine uptake protein TcyP (sodium:dicarboxylate symporter family)